MRSAQELIGIIKCSQTRHVLRRKRFNGKLSMKMEAAERHQKRLIRAAYPNGSDKPGYRIVLTMQEAKRFAIPYWVRKWADKLTPQASEAY